MSGFSLEELAVIIRARNDASADKSYTKSLLEGGPARVSRKLGEEAVETIIAALDGNAEALRDEAADLLYHLLVLLEVKGVKLEDVMSELERRTDRSGLDEKASR